MRTQCIMLGLYRTLQGLYWTLFFAYLQLYFVSVVLDDGPYWSNTRCSGFRQTKLHNFTVVTELNSYYRTTLEYLICMPN